MQLIKQFNLVISFLLELLVFTILAYYGFHAAENSAGKYLLAFSLPLAAALLWGLFAAPRSSRRIRFPYRIIFEILVLSSGVLLLHKMGLPIFSICLGLVILINKILSYLWKQ